MVRSDMPQLGFEMLDERSPKPSSDIFVTLLSHTLQTPYKNEGAVCFTILNLLVQPAPIRQVNKWVSLTI